MSFEVEYEGDDYFIVYKDRQNYPFHYDFKTKNWKRPFIQLTEQEEAKVQEAKRLYEAYYDRIRKWIDRAAEEESEYQKNNERDHIIYRLEEEEIFALLTFRNKKLEEFSIGEDEFEGWYFAIEFLYEHFPKIKDTIEWIAKKSRHRLRLLF